MIGRCVSRVLVTCLALGLAGTVAVAETAVESDPGARRFLGHGRLFVNDTLADGKDRWRTGSLAASWVWGRGWNGALPSRAGDILEFRFGGEIIAPDNLTRPPPGDRPWAGQLSFGLHTHFERGGWQWTAGADAVVIGPQTGLDSLQNALHDIVGIPGLSPAVRAAQIPDQVLARGVVELGRDFEMWQGVWHPFVEARAGDETLLRAGVDVTFGRFGEGELLVRDWVTGHRYRAVRNQQDGLSLVLGADVAKVFDSVYLPSSRGYRLTDTRTRLRFGVHGRQGKAHVFYGLAWLDKEFVAQSEGQVVGAIRLDFRF